MSEELQKRIQDLLKQYKVMLFMKGTPEEPQCGFSATAAGILVESNIYFETFDIYSDEEIRQGLKEYSNWPTYPQLYIDGELIGGVDIMMEMYDNGEFQALKIEKNL